MLSRICWVRRGYVTTVIRIFDLISEEEGGGGKPGDTRGQQGTKAYHQAKWR
jgi:hypothetical protein